MKSRERVITALKLKQPDRVPITELSIHKNIYSSLMPEASCQADFEEAYGLDTVFSKNEYMILSEQDDTFIDEWKVKYKRTAEDVSIPFKSPIESFDDYKKYKVPDADRPERLGRLPELVKKFKGEKAIIFAQRAFFMWSAYLLGMENLLINFITEPDFIHEFFDKILDFNIKLTRNAIRAGADIIFETDDYAYNKGLLFSPQIYEEFINPRLKQFVKVVHDEGGMIVKHSDGNLMKIIDRIVDTGIDGLNPIDPQAGMDISEIKQKFGDKVCLWGNIDCGNLLTFGSVNEVEEAVKNCIENASAGGGFVLSSSNSIHSSVKPENYEAMLKYGRQYGAY